MKWVESFETVKTAAAVLSAIYPFFAGLYIFGFFWGAPFDLLSAFSPTDFLFKSAAVFFSIAATVFVYFCFLTFYYLLVVEKVVGPSPKAKEPDMKPAEKHKRWKDLSPRGVAGICFIQILVVLLAALALYLDNEPFSILSLPDILALLLVCGLLFQVGISLSLDLEEWQLVKTLYFSSCVFILPIWVGHQDFKISKSSPTFQYQGEECSVRFAGYNTVLAKCGEKEIMVQKDMNDMVYELK